MGEPRNDQPTPEREDGASGDRPTADNDLTADNDVEEDTVATVDPDNAPA
ncbi:hypothetical protein [Microterricola viridarii]|uniref:Uncharacterized protein n=1 Tax=Microterricola viridarii TaxID=412690 RepID=A0A1H1W392_9MICO|nr:hypothetical protein [Microterricola viridarii]SDS91544.1 hypothetical protein SAMN04489834_2427 [Microterricola viridarii]